ncbi:uncharacterized protein LOC131363271 [Hemibagrus wyckioides]|uniref:uncharacterized protein LOC131363271 n=1 Tax=Hemibagrus wyckioides TaxID=337641 RepID=UPI00266B8FF9|nr:uncharacterized protein LOC131363271 [Hemibagrus wyckioides]
MIPSTRENSKTLKKGNTREGRDKVEPRYMTDPDKPAGQMDSATGRHVEPKSLQDSDPKTSSSLLLLPHPCPQEGQRRGDGRKKKTAPSTNQQKKRKKGQKNDVVWNFINNKKSAKEILDYIKINISTYLLFSNDRNNKEKNINLQMLKKHQPKDLKKNKYRQQAFAILKLKNNTLIMINNKIYNLIKVIGPFYPEHNKHSEDFIFEEIEKRNDISEVWIYTTNSPCLGRKSHSPCMLNLINLAISRQIKINIVFSNYYIFKKNMYSVFQNLGDDETRDWNSDHKFQVQFNITEFIYNCEENKKIKDNHLITAAYNIIKNILPEYSGLEKTYKDWHQTGSETLAELESTLREEMKIKDNCLTATCKIIMNILSKYLGLENMYKDWHQTGSGTLAELESTLREEMKERREMMESSDEEFSEITKEYKEWWTRTIDENLSRHVVPSILENIHDFCPNLEFFQVDLEDCFNLANEE